MNRESRDVLRKTLVGSSACRFSSSLDNQDAFVALFLPRQISFVWLNQKRSSLRLNGPNTNLSARQEQTHGIWHLQVFHSNDEAWQQGTQTTAGSWPTKIESRRNTLEWKGRNMERWQRVINAKCFHKAHVVGFTSKAAHGARGYPHDATEPTATGRGPAAQLFLLFSSGIKSSIQIFYPVGIIESRRVFA